MDSLFAAVLLVGVGYLMFRAGKQTGSRLGFGAGRRSRRRRCR
jgi:hypothetical protein